MRERERGGEGMGNRGGGREEQRRRSLGREGHD